MGPNWGKREGECFPEAMKRFKYLFSVLNGEYNFCNK
jgi:hypothetical protein